MQLFENNKWINTLLFVCLTAMSVAHASDTAKEKRWEEQIVPSLMVGDAVHLEADGVQFLALEAEPTTDKVAGGLIILHGIGVHPAWPDIIDPVRMNLPDDGWYTLSLQMPILRNEAEDDEYGPLFDEVPGRIQAGVDYLKSKGIDNIVIAGHSLGVTMAMYYLAGQADAAVKAMISCGSGPGYPADARMDSLANFRKIGIPYVDIYGGQDSDRVRNAAEKRAKVARESGKEDYTLIKVDGADHFFAGMQDEIVALVREQVGKFAAVQ